MTKQIVINRETGEKFEATDYLRVADAVRISGYNSIRSEWGRVMQGEEVELSAAKIEGLGRYLRPVVAQAPAVQTPQIKHDWRDDPASEKQLGYLRDLGVRIGGPLTKRQASQMIDAARQGDAALDYQDGPANTEVY
jgi:hypothetical protein